MRHIRTSFNHWSSIGNKTSFNWKSWVTVNLQYFAHWLCLYQDQNIQSAEALRHPVYKFSPFIYIGANRSYLTTIFVIIHFQSPATGRVASEHVNRSAPVTRRGSSPEWCLLLTHRMCCMFTEPNGARRVCVMLTLESDVCALARVAVSMFRQEPLCSDSFTFLRQTTEN